MIRQGGQKHDGREFEVWKGGTPGFPLFEDDFQELLGSSCCDLAYLWAALATLPPLFSGNKQPPKLQQVATGFASFNDNKETA